MRVGWRKASATLTGWIRRLLRRRLTCDSVVNSVLDVPDQLTAHTAVLVQPQRMPPQWLAFDCPCPQGHRLLVNLSFTRSPAWTLTLGQHGEVSLAPSVDSHSPAGRCHFWLQDGRIVWVQA